MRRMDWFVVFVWQRKRKIYKKKINVIIVLIKTNYWKKIWKIDEKMDENVDERVNEGWRSIFLLKNFNRICWWKWILLFCNNIATRMMQRGESCVNPKVLLNNNPGDGRYENIYKSLWKTILFEKRKTKSIREKKSQNELQKNFWNDLKEIFIQNFQSLQTTQQVTKRQRGCKTKQ